jgi:hypothetical protein
LPPRELIRTMTVVAVFFQPGERDDRVHGAK